MIWGYFDFGFIWFIWCWNRLLLDSSDLGFFLLLDSYGSYDFGSLFALGFKGVWASLVVDPYGSYDLGPVCSWIQMCLGSF